MAVDVGVVVLPQQRWAEAAARWKAVEDMGFAHAWTYDHLAWRAWPTSRGSPRFPPHGRRTGDLAGSAGHVGRLAELPPPGALRQGADEPGRRQRRPLRAGRGRRWQRVGRRGAWRRGAHPGQRAARLEEFVELLDLVLTRPHHHLAGTVLARSRRAWARRRAAAAAAVRGGRQRARPCGRGGPGAAGRPPARPRRGRSTRGGGRRRLAARFDDALAAAGRDPVRGGAPDLDSARCSR